MVLSYRRDLLSSQGLLLIRIH